MRVSSIKAPTKNKPSLSQATLVLTWPAPPIGRRKRGYETHGTLPTLTLRSTKKMQFLCAMSMLHMCVPNVSAKANEASLLTRSNQGTWMAEPPIKVGGRGDMRHYRESLGPSTNHSGVCLSQVSQLQIKGLAYPKQPRSLAVQALPSSEDLRRNDILERLLRHCKHSHTLQNTKALNR